jgi:hypothetical protein
LKSINKKIIMPLLFETGLPVQISGRRFSRSTALYQLKAPEKEAH